MKRVDVGINIKSRVFPPFLAWGWNNPDGRKSSSSRLGTISFHCRDGATELLIAMCGVKYGYPLEKLTLSLCHLLNFIVYGVSSTTPVKKEQNYM